MDKMGGFDVGNAVGKFITRSFLRRREKHDSNSICDSNIGQCEIFGGRLHNLWFFCVDAQVKGWETFLRSGDGGGGEWLGKEGWKGMMYKLRVV